MAKEKLYRHSFESMAMALQAIETKAPQGAFAANPSSVKTDDPDWSGSKDMPSALAMARHGWPEGRAKMQSAHVDATRALAVAQAPALWRDVAGAYPVAALAVAGAPDAMVSPLPAIEQARPIVRLAVICSNSAMVNASEIVNYGAALLGIVDALEQEQVQCEINAVYCFRPMHENTSKSVLEVNLKQAGDALDLEKLAFSLVSPSMLRRIVFALKERHCPDEYRPGYGVPCLPDDTWFPGQIVLPPAQSFRGTLRTPAMAAVTVRETLGKALAGQLETLPPIFDEQVEG